MGGWVSLFGNVSDFDYRLNRFKEIFSVEGVPNLKLYVHSDLQEVRVICWAWNREEVPDIQIVRSKSTMLILSGVITDLGRFGPSLPTQLETSKRVLELWFKYGEKIISQLNGSFCCLFYNQETKKITIFTDRFASRSIWMTEEEKIWIIGNFPSAVAVMKRKQPRINPVGLWSLFHTGRHLGHHGIYHDIYALIAGHKAVLNPGCKPSISHWWERRYVPHNSVTPSHWGAQLAEALVTSANRYKRVCRKPHLFLSGGLDSRIVAAAFRDSIKALTLCSMTNAESRIASLVSKVIGIEHQVIHRSPYWYLETLDAAALISSGNFLTKHTHFIIPVRDVCAQAPDSEFFLGDLLENFNKHYFSLPRGSPLIFSPEHIKEFLVKNVPCSMKDTSRLGIYFNQKIKKGIESRYEQALKEFAEPILKVSENHADRFDTFLRWADVSLAYTYNMFTCIWPLARERNIYFDNELNELSLKIPAMLRGEGKLHKWILYHLDKKLIFIPDSNIFLPPFLPRKTEHLIKKIRPVLGKLRRNRFVIRKDGPRLNTSGSWVLNEEMYRKDPRYRSHIEGLITDKSLFPPDIFNFEQIKKTWKEYLSGGPNRQFDIEVLLSFGSLSRLIPFAGIEL